MDFLYDFWHVPIDFDLYVLSFGYTVAALLLLFSTIIVAAIYYLWLGKSTDSYANIGSWFVFGLINMVLIFILTLSILGFKLKENTSIAEIETEIWIFSVVNAFIYGFIFYLIVSILMNSSSKYSKYIPFNLFK